MDRDPVEQSCTKRDFIARYFPILPPLARDCGIPGGTTAWRDDESEPVACLDVQIRERPGLRPFPVARARVLQSIRGTAEGQIVEIYAPETSCGGGLDHRSVGSQGFIAGRFRQIAGETLFSGTWTNRQIGKVLGN
jgi:hypothetical protein